MPLLMFFGCLAPVSHHDYHLPYPRSSNCHIASLQIPFLLKIASDFTQYVRSFPPTPKPALLLLAKLDHCFSSLLLGRDVKSGETLPGFENGSRGGMTTTDMVRCRSLVEQTRVLMVEILGNASWADDDDDGEAEEVDDSDIAIGMSDTGGTNVARYAAWDFEDEDMHLDAARIYQNTIFRLGESLGEPLNGLGPSSDATCG